MTKIQLKLVYLALCLVFLTGCAQQGIYQWGGYDSLLYQSYKNPEKAIEFRRGLESHILKMEESRRKVAPGLYAELGTLYLQAGDSKNAVAMYTKERDVWPESKGLMNTLIKNISNRPNATPAVKS